MAKKAAVLAANPVNGLGLFQYLESLLENDVPYKVLAVSDTREIKTNSGITLFVDDVIANLKGHEDELDTPVFARDDAVPVFKDNTGKAYNIDLMEVTRAFDGKGKLMIGHCAAVMTFNFTGITAGRRLAVRLLAKPAIQTGQATDRKSEIDGNFYTTRGENTPWIMMPQLIEALKK